MTSEALDAAFHAFRETVRTSSLYDRAYLFYALYLVLILMGIALSVYVLTVTDNLFVQILNAIFLGFVLVQGGMLGHDLTHGQVFRNPRISRWTAVFAWGLFGGLSADKWFEKHNAHHKFVNQIDNDPDLDIPFIFSQKQLTGNEPTWRKVLLRYQHLIFFALLPFVYTQMLWQAYEHIFKRFTLQSAVELVLMTLHFVLLFGAVFYFLQLPVAIAFTITNLVVSGVYMSLAFAPNHKGLEVLEHSEKVSWFNQITSTRNIYPSTTVFYMLGGLNFQVEHHLFSDMARPNYWKVQKKVQEFCDTHGIPYYQTTWRGSMVEIYHALRKQAVV